MAFVNNFLVVSKPPLVAAINRNFGDFDEASSFVAGMSEGRGGIEGIEEMMGSIMVFESIWSGEETSLCMR